MKKVNGSTLIEVLVAFVILATVFSAAMTVISKSLQNNTNFSVLQANCIADSINNNFSLHSTPNFNTFKSKGLLVNFETQSHSMSNNIFVVSVSISYPNGILIRRYHFFKSINQ